MYQHLFDVLQQNAPQRTCRSAATEIAALVFCPQLIIAETI